MLDSVYKSKTKWQFSNKIICNIMLNVIAISLALHTLGFYLYSYQSSIDVGDKGLQLRGILVMYFNYMYM